MADLYSNWLNIPPGPRPPNHFELLGLPADTEDTERIEQAARAQAQRIREHVDAASADAAKALMQEVAQARAVLLDPAKRTDYRASLRARSAGEPWWQGKSGPHKAVSPPTPPLATRPVASPAISAGSRKSNKPSKLPLAFLAVSGVGLVGIAAAAVVAIVILGTSPKTTDQALRQPTTPEAPPRSHVGIPPVRTVSSGPAAQTSFIAQAEPPPSTALPLTSVKEFKRHTGLVQMLAVSPRQGRFMSAGSGGAIEWELASGRSFLRHDFRTPAIAAAYLTGGRQAVCADEGSVLVLDLATNEIKTTLKIPRGNLQCLAVDPDGKHIVTGGSDGSVLWWDLATAKVEQKIELGETVSAACVAVSLDRRFLAAGGSDGSLGVWQLAGGKPLWRGKHHPGGVAAVTFAADSKRLASAGLDGSIGLWEAVSGKNLARLPGHAGAALSVAFVKGGAGLVSGGRDKSVKFWNLDTKQLLRVIELPGAIHALAVPTSDSFVLAAGAGGMVQALPMPSLDLEILTPEEPPQQKLSKPDAAAAAEALSAIRQKHNAPLATAKPEEQLTFAERCLARATAKTEPTPRWAFFREAIDGFVRLGKPSSALNAVAEMDRWFEIDELADAAHALADLTKSAPPAGQKEIVEAGLKLLAKADAEARPDVAGPLLAAIGQAAQKSAAADLVKRVATFTKEREAASKAKDRLSELETKVKSNPSDKAANLEYGLMLCARDRWADGLARIAKGNDETLAGLARRDLADPQQPKARAELGHGWADAAARAKEMKHVVFARAKHWFEQAQAGLTGDERSKVILKLGEVTAQLSNLKSAPEKAPAAGNSGVKPAGAAKSSEVQRRNFNTLRNESVLRSQWNVTGKTRIEALGLRLLDGDITLESKFLLADNWRLEIVLSRDNRSGTIDVNGERIAMRTGIAAGKPGLIVIERKGKRFAYSRSATSKTMDTPTIIELPEARQAPSRIVIRVTGKLDSNSDGGLLGGIIISGSVRPDD